MTAARCPICNQALSGCVCPNCGFDTSRDYESFPSLERIPARLPSVATRRALCDREKQNPWKNMRPVLWFALAALLIVLVIGYAAVRLRPNLVTITIKDFEYETSGSGVTITGYTGDGGEVVIPAEIDGKPVTSIGDNAFSYCESLTSVSIPDSVTSIGTSAFWSCGSLTSVNIPNSVTSIGAYAFIWCNSLTSVSIPDSVTSVDISAFSGCDSLKDVYYSGTEVQWKSISIDAYNDDLTSATIHYQSNPTNNQTPTPVKYFEYGTYGNGVTITKYTGDDSEVVIPAAIDGKPVTSIGDYAFYRCSSLTSVSIPNNVTSIGRSAFYWCNSLTSVSIPNSVTSIGTGAFAHCESLTSISVESGNATFTEKDGVLYTHDMHTLLVYPIGRTDSRFTIPDSVTLIGSSAFFRCSSLIRVSIPDSVTSICAEAFSNCSSLTSISIPDSVMSIGNAAFANCDSLKEIDYSGTEAQWNAISIGGYNDPLTSATIQYQPNSGNDQTPKSTSTPVMDFEYETSSSGVTITGYTGDGGEVVIPAEIDGKPVTSIGDEAFIRCSSLTSVSIPNSVRSIGAYAFYECDSLTTIEIPTNVRSIGDLAFCGCASLKIIEIPSSVTSIGEYAFSSCISLKSVTIREGVTSIGPGVFSSCDSLASVTLPKSVTNIDGLAFDRCTSLKTIEIPSSVTRIGSGAFHLCSSLMSVTIPESVTIIGDYAFYECSSLASVTIIEGVTSIWEAAFSGCSSLTSVTIPASVTDIRSNPFASCKSLTEIVVKTGNNAYLAKDGVLYTSDMTILLAFPAGKTGTNYAIPEGVTIIGDSAFEFCSSLTSVTIPDSVTSIMLGAFSSCSSLKTVYYGGAKEQWSKIEIDDNNEYLAKAEIIHEEVPEPELVTIIVKNQNWTCDGTAHTLDQNAYAVDGLQGDDTVNVVLSIVDANGHILDAVTDAGTYSIKADVSGYDTARYTVRTTGVGTLTIEAPELSPSPVEDFRYTLSKDGVEITHYNGVGGIVVIPAEINGKPVTSIGHDAFSSCDTLTTIKIPSSVTSIGEWAFYSCYNLKTIEIPSGVTSLENWAFANCDSLKTIEIPSTVTSIWDNAFALCDSLEAITVAKGNSAYKTIDGVLYTESGDVLIAYPAAKSDTSFTISPSVTSIGDSAFAGSLNLETIEIHPTVTSIGDYAFFDCSSLKSITIPDSVTSIGSAAFAGCENLKIIEIPSSVTSIGNSAFGGCTSLTMIEIPSSVTSIGNNPFSSCHSLKAIAVAEGNAMYKAINGVLYTESGDVLIAYPAAKSDTTFTIPSGVISIGENAFHFCDSLTTIDIPPSVTSIGNNAFEFCTSLTTIDIPSSVTSIGEWAFRQCYNLMMIDIPASVTSIGNNAFQYCRSLTDVYYTGTEEQWQAIRLGDSNDSLTYATIHYNSK